MKKNIYGRIVTIEYDPNRNASICLIHYGDGEKKYQIGPIKTVTLLYYGLFEKRIPTIEFKKQYRDISQKKLKHENEVS